MNKPLFIIYRSLLFPVANFDWKIYFILVWPGLLSPSCHLHRISFFYPFTFILIVSLSDSLIGSILLDLIFTFIQPLCLLFEKCNLFIFKVITNRSNLTIDILFIISWYFCSSFFVFFYSCCLPLWLFFVAACFNLSFYLFCIYQRFFPLWLPWVLHKLSYHCNSWFQVDNNLTSTTYKNCTTLLLSPHFMALVSHYIFSCCAPIKNYCN